MVKGLFKKEKTQRSDFSVGNMNCDTCPAVRCDSAQHTLKRDSLLSTE